MPNKQLVEHGRLLEATSTDTSGAVRRPIQIITPGWGSSGYYSAEVLEAAATERVIPAGTHMYFNHASESERHDRPERDVRDIAAVLAEDARWDGQRLIAEAEIMGPHAELIESLAPYIGVSISGSATDVTVGEAEGRTGPIIEGLAHVASVDFVTRAGRGGMVLLESARPSLVNARAIGNGIAEATANETREQLQQLLRDTFGAEKSWVWVRDFDETTVWYEHETPESSGTYGISYVTGDDGAVTALDGSPTEVRAATTYVPVNGSALDESPTFEADINKANERLNAARSQLHLLRERLREINLNVPVTRPDSTNPTTEETLEVTMGNTQIEESELARLRETAGRVDALESERDTATQERDAARAELAERDRTDRARAIVAEQAATANVTFTPLEERGLLATLPRTDDGALDEAAFTTTVTEAAASVAASRGAGTITGFGGSPVGGQPTVSEADIDGAVGGAFGRTQVKEA